MPRPVQWACRLDAEPDTKGWRSARRGDHFDRLADPSYVDGRRAVLARCWRSPTTFWARRSATTRPSVRPPSPPLSRLVSSG